MEAIGIDHPKPCGTCTLCCKLYALPDLDKPAGQWCAHCVQGRGCTIHETRPGGCRTFQCAWSVAAAMDDKWRPDTAGFVVIAADNRQVFIDVDPGRPDSWRRQPYYAQLKSWSSRANKGYLTVIVRAPKHVVVVFPEAEIDLGPNPGDVEIVSGYERKEGGWLPYARFVPAAEAPRG